MMYCIKCGYDLSAIHDEVNFCPKCGTGVQIDNGMAGHGKQQVSQPPVVTHQPKGRAAAYQPQPQGIQMQSLVGGQQVITVWMERPEQIHGVPPGLEYLSQLDQLLIKQQLELLEITSKMHQPNKYNINNSVGQQVYFVFEESDDCTRMYCPQGRSFVLHCMDNFNQEIMRMSREYVCCPCTMCAACSGASRTEFTVEAPVGNIIGYVTQGTSLCATVSPNYSISDASRKEVAVISGPGCICQGQCCTSDQEFQVLDPMEREVGMVTKQWTTYAQEIMTKANNFSVTFSVDANIMLKALLFAATFVVDYTIFE